MPSAINGSQSKEQILLIVLLRDLVHSPIKYSCVVKKSNEGKLWKIPLLQAYLYAVAKEECEYPI
jgi:hypothetical protein